MRHAATLVLAALLGLAAPLPASADDPSGNGAPIAIPADDADIDGREIYRRVLRNRFHSVTQHTRLVSGDRGGRTQETRFDLHWQDHRNGEEQPEDGVVSKTVVTYTHPFDVRHASYLIIENYERVNDQFVYLPSRRSVKRVNLRSEAVFGTDFSFEDVIPRELEDSTYERLPDEYLDDLPVFVVRLVPRDHANSEYSRVVVYVDKARYVLLQARYWDSAGVEVKRLRADPGRVQRFGDVWVPLELTMRHLLLESFTVMKVDDLVPNPNLPETMFELRRLEQN